MPGLKNYRNFGQELKSGDFRHLEQILQVLEGEEHKPGFAVFKQDIWSYLKNLHLNEHQKRRLRNAAIGCLNRRMARDFWAMAKFMGRIDRRSTQPRKGVNAFIRRKRQDTRSTAFSLFGRARDWREKRDENLGAKFYKGSMDGEEFGES